MGWSSPACTRWVGKHRKDRKVWAVSDLLSPFELPRHVNERIWGVLFINTPRMCQDMNALQSFCCRIHGGWLEAPQSKSVSGKCRWPKTSVDPGSEGNVTWKKLMSVFNFFGFWLDRWQAHEIMLTIWVGIGKSFKALKKSSRMSCHCSGSS